MKVSDVVLGPVIVAIGLIAIYASSLQPRPFFGSAYGGGFFPTIVGIGLVGGGLLLTVSGWRERVAARGATGAALGLVAMGGWIRSPRHVGNVLVVLCALIFYIATSDWLGFLISGFIVVFATMYQFSRALLTTLVVSLITILVAKLAFQDLLLVPLPWGLLEPYAGVLRWR